MEGIFILLTISGLINQGLAINCYSGTYFGLHHPSNDTFEKKSCGNIFNSCLQARYNKTIGFANVEVVVAECYNDATGCEYSSCPVDPDNCKTMCCSTDYCNEYTGASVPFHQQSLIYLASIVVVVSYLINHV